MSKKQNKSFHEFNKVLQQLKEEGKISDAPPSSEREERREYITKLTKLFKERIYSND
jgi:hypothetical protein|tara:strand:- start:340 stop:510 length:171 start_codon:yes stop_codon:yes gene_type:complete